MLPRQMGIPARCSARKGSAPQTTTGDASVKATTSASELHGVDHRQCDHRHSQRERDEQSGPQLRSLVLDSGVHPVGSADLPDEPLGAGKVAVYPVASTVEIKLRVATAPVKSTFAFSVA